MCSLAVISINHSQYESSRLAYFEESGGQKHGDLKQVYGEMSTAVQLSGDTNDNKDFPPDKTMEAAAQMGHATPVREDGYQGLRNLDC